jgi:hypothetical protein
MNAAVVKCIFVRGAKNNTNDIAPSGPVDRKSC